MHSSISQMAIQVALVVQFEVTCLLEIKQTQTSGSNENNSNLNALVHRLSDNKRYSHVCFTGDFNFHINWHQWSTSFSSHSKKELFLETSFCTSMYSNRLDAEEQISPQHWILSLPERKTRSRI